MPPLEKTIVKNILKALNALPRTKAIKTHGSCYLEAGTPDIIGCSHGFFFAFEVKRPSDIEKQQVKVTAIQAQRLAEWARAYGAVYIVTSAHQAVEHVKILPKLVRRVPPRTVK